MNIKNNKQAAVLVDNNLSCMYIFCAPDDEWKNNLKHVEHL